MVALSCQTTPSLNLRQPERLSAILQEIKPDLIINAAAYTAVDRAEEEPELACNVILFPGDGMGISTVTVARMLEGQLLGGQGEAHFLAFERLPYTVFVKTYNTNQ